MKAHTSTTESNFNNHAFQSEKEALSFEKKAQDLIHSLTKSFLKEANISLSNMKSALDNLSFSNISEQERIIQTSFFQAAHDLKGQGSTYGYPLITKIADHICNQIKNQKHYSKETISSFKQNVEDMIELINEAPNHQNTKLEKRILERLEYADE